MLIQIPRRCANGNENTDIFNHPLTFDQNGLTSSVCHMAGLRMAYNRRLVCRRWRTWEGQFKTHLIQTR